MSQRRRGVWISAELFWYCRFEQNAAADVQNTMCSASFSHRFTKLGQKPVRNFQKRDLFPSRGLERFTFKTSWLWNWAFIHFDFRHLWIFSHFEKLCHVLPLRDSGPGRMRRLQVNGSASKQTADEIYLLPRRRLSSTGLSGFSASGDLNSPSNVFVLSSTIDDSLGLTPCLGRLNSSDDNNVFISSLRWRENIIHIHHWVEDSAFIHVFHFLFHVWLN